MSYPEQNIVDDGRPALYVPSDDELNRAAAELCGWVPIPEEEDGWTNGTQKRWPRPPDYCNDRNALPELWAKVEAEQKQCEFARALDTLLQYSWSEMPEHTEYIRDDMEYGLWRFATAPARTHVIAFLKAMDKWRAEWLTE